MRLLYFILLLFLQQEIIFSQVISVIDSLSHEPIQNVNIVSINSDRSSVTNKNGEFNLSLFEKSDSLKITHIAFRPKILSFNEVLLQKFIVLVPSSIPQDEITVIDKKYEEINSSFYETIEITEELKQSYINIGDVLQTNSSVFVKDYGGFSGAKIISARGMSSENTVVLFNEARVNYLSTGIFDLSSISTFSIEKLEYINSFDEESSYSSAGGILKIFSGQKFEQRKINLALRLSSDLYQSAFAEYKDGTENFNFTINGERSYSSNHYKYNFQDKELKRENAHFNKSFLSGGINYLNDDFQLNFYTNYHYLNSGIPGFVVTNNFNSSKASNRSKSFLSILNTKYSLNEKINLSSVFSYNTQSLELTDPEGLTVNSSNKNESILSNFSALIKSEFLVANLQLYLGDEVNYSSLKNIVTFFSANDLPEKIERISNEIFSGFNIKFNTPLNFINSFSLNGKINYNISDELLNNRIKTDRFTYNFGLTLIPNLTPFLIFKTNFGSNYRLPTFNERYYSSLYSHYELNPESYKVFDAGFESAFNFLGKTSLSFAYFLIDGKDKIIWIPTRLALQTPRNVSNIRSSGIELGTRQNFFNDNLNFSIFFTYTDTKNISRISQQDNSYNKQLIYLPRHKFNFNISAKINDINLTFFSTYVDQRFYTTDNNPLYILPEYFVIDFSTSYSFQLFEKPISVSAAIYNLLNEDYFVIQSYPMPLRTYLLTFNLEIL